MTCFLGQFFIMVKSPGILYLPDIRRYLVLGQFLYDGHGLLQIVARRSGLTHNMLFC